MSQTLFVCYDFNEHFDRVVSLMNQLKRTPPCVLDMLCDNENSSVLSVLRHREDKTPPAWEAGTLNVHMKTYAEQRIRWGSLKPRPSAKDSPWFATLGARETDCLLHSQKVKPHAKARDIGQSIYRVSLSSTVSDGAREFTVLPTLLPNSKIWLDDSKYERFLIGFEMLMVHAFPVWKHREYLESKSNKLLSDLAGNMFAGQVMMAFMVSVLFSAAWLPQDDNADDEDGASLAAAMAAFRSAHGAEDA